MESTLKKAVENKEDKVYITVRGKVSRFLKDDEEGSSHQRWILDGDEEDVGLSVMVIHNLERFDRVPLELGDRMEVRGKYVWNDKGGLVHWTNHAVHGEVEGGYIKLLKKDQEPFLFQ